MQLGLAFPRMKGTVGTAGQGRERERNLTGSVMDGVA